jgi:hypothetical protein
MKTTTPINSDHSFITKLPTFAERGGAIERRLDEVKSNPKYQAMTEDHKSRIRADIYKKYVTPSYQGFHLPVPDEKTWVEATARDTEHLVHGTPTSQSYNEVSGRINNAERRLKELKQDVGVGDLRAIHNIELFGTRVANSTLLHMFGLMDHFSHVENPNIPKPSEVYKKSETARLLSNIENTKRQQVQDADFWIQTHPRDTTLGRLGVMAGEQIATLPLYEGLTAEKIGEVVGVPLTAKLIKSPVGKFVASRIINAADGFMASLATSGGSAKTGVEGAAGFAFAGAGQEVGGKVLKIAAAPLIKKWTATTLAMGGKPFAEEIAKSAMAEEEEEMSHTGEGLEQIKRAVQIKQWMEQQTLRVVDDNAQRSFKVRAWKEAQEQRALHDPVMHKLHQGEKVSLNSIAVQMFDKPLAGISHKQRAQVLGRRMDLIQQAASEAPVHLPDLHREEIKKSIETARQANPVMNDVMARMEKLGVKFPEAVQENAEAAIAKETGISNVKAAGKKVVKVAHEETGTPITVAGFASLNNDSKAYFRNPRNRTEFAAAVSDRSKAGANKFIDVMRKGNPGNIHFEDPAQMLLFHYGNRKDLPPGIVASIKYRLGQTKGWENADAKQLDLAARYMHNHIYDMAKSGRLKTEGNIFRSTKLSGPMSWSPWQAPLADEASEKIINRTTKALQQHPAALQTYRTLVKTFRRNWMTAKNPEEYIAFKEALDESSNRIKSATINNPFIISGK